MRPLLQKYSQSHPYYKLVYVKLLTTFCAMQSFFHIVGTDEEGPIMGVLSQRTITFCLKIEVNLETS